MRTVDLIVIGTFIGPVGVAAVGIGDIFARIVLQIALGLGAGTIALVSQSYGAGKTDLADIVTTQSVLLSFLLGVPIIISGWFTASHLFMLLGAEPAVTDLGAVYLRVVFLSAPFRILGIIGARALHGVGDTRTPMIATVSGTILNIVLTVVLVSGIIGPMMGVVGAAIGTSVGNLLTGLIILGVFLSGRWEVRFRYSALWAPDVLEQIVRIGFPEVLSRNVYAIGDIPLNALILVFGTEINAAFQIGRRIQQYARMPNWGFSTAASTLVGNHLGSDEPELSSAYGRLCVFLAVGSTLLVAIGLFIAALPVSRVFISDAITLQYATDWVRVLGIATVLQSVFIVLRGGLQGAGDTKWPLYATIIGIGGFSLSFSYIVSVVLGFGPIGIYLGIILDYLVRSLIVGHRFIGGAWKETVLDDEFSSTASHD
jgi:putative MATE family efflux protein